MITIRFREVIDASGEPRMVEWTDVLRGEWRAWPHLRRYPGWRGHGEGWGWRGLACEVPS